MRTTKPLILAAALAAAQASAAMSTPAHAVPCATGAGYVCDWSEFVTANVPAVITWNFLPLHGFTLALPSGVNSCWAEDDYLKMGPAGPDHGFPFGYNPGSGQNVVYATPPGYTPIGGVSVYCNGAGSVWVEARSF